MIDELVLYTLNLKVYGSHITAPYSKIERRKALYKEFKEVTYLNLLKIVLVKLTNFIPFNILYLNRINIQLVVKYDI